MEIGEELDVATCLGKKDLLDFCLDTLLSMKEQSEWLAELQGSRPWNSLDSQASDGGYVLTDEELAQLHQERAVSLVTSLHITDTLRHCDASTVQKGSAEIGGQVSGSATSRG